MGLFNKIVGKNKLSKTPPMPSINNKQDFVVWMLRYHEELTYLRKMFSPKGLNILLDGVAKDIMHELNTCQSKKVLMDKLAVIGEVYDTMQPIIQKRGNIMLCPEEIKIHYINCTTKLTILPYFLKYKYNDNLLFDRMGLKEL